MKKLIRLAIAAGAVMATLAFTGSAMAAYAPRLIVTSLTNGPNKPTTMLLEHLQTANDDATAKDTIYVPLGYQANLTQAPGTKIGDVDATLILRGGGNATATATGPVIVDSAANWATEAMQCTRTATHESVWRLDIRLNANNRVFVSGMGLESEWRAELAVQGTTATPALVGNIDLIRGTLGLAGRRFRVDQGHIAFLGSRPPNPQIDLAATAEIEDVNVTINVSGRANNPQIAFTSSPSLPQDEVMARILFGSSVTQISALQAVQLAASLNSLRGGSGGLNPLGQLRSATGIDRLRLIEADSATGRGTAVAAGMYLSDDIYVEIITDAKGFTATQLEISLSRSLSLLSQFSTNASNNASIRYHKDY